MGCVEKGGCGSAVLAAGIPNLGIAYAGVSLAFGLTVLTMAYTIGHISGCHLNPAVTIGLWAGGRFPAKDIPLYVIAQVIGAVLASAAILYIASRAPGFDLSKGMLAANGYGEHSPHGYAMAAGLVNSLQLSGTGKTVYLSFTVPAELLNLIPKAAVQ